MDRLRAFAACAALAAAPLAAGCGAASGSHATTPPAPPSPAVAGRLVSAGRVLAAATGGIGAGSVRMTVTVTPAGQLPGNRVRAVGAFTTRPPLRGWIAMSLPTPSGVVSLAVRVLPGAVYLHAPAGVRMIGGRWVRMGGGSLWQAGSPAAQGQSPTAVLGMLAGAPARVVDLGPATVGGVATTHYRFTVDLRAVPARVPAAQRAWMRRVVAGLIAAGHSSTVPMQVFVDRRGRLRRATYSVGSPADRVDVVVGMSGYGVPVHVSAPPANQVVALPAALAVRLARALR